MNEREGGEARPPAPQLPVRAGDVGAAPRPGWWLRAASPPSPAAGSARSSDPAAGGALPFRSLMAFIVVLLLAPQSFIPALAPLRIGLLTAALAIAAHLLDRFLRGRASLRMTRESGAVAALVAWSIVSLPFSYWPGGSLAFLLGNYLKIVALFWLISSVVTTAARLRKAVWGLTLMAIPMAGFGLSGYLSGEVLSAATGRRLVGYEAPLTHNPNDLALMLNLIIPLAAALFLIQERPLVRAFLAACIALSIAAVLATFSRAGFLTLATTLALYSGRFLRRPGRRRWAALAIALALASVPFLPASYLERLGTIADIEADPTGSAQERWGDIVAALRFVAQNPIVGAGVGMNVLALNDIRGPAWKEVHNVYLEYAVDLGLPGLALFLALLFGCVRSARAVRRQAAGSHGGPDLPIIAEGIEISLWAFSVAAVFHPVAYDAYFYLVAGLAGGVSAAARPAWERS
jgi:O-antigen ligase